MNAVIHIQHVLLNKRRAKVKRIIGHGNGGISRRRQFLTRVFCAAFLASNVDNSEDSDTCDET
jgi:hypothetical protein